MEVLYDLHIHSRWSDGDYSPAKVAQLVKEQGLLGAILADHDTVLGWPEFSQTCGQLNLFFVQGVEISALFEDLELHILGYSLSFNAELLKPLLEQARLAYFKRLQAISQKLKDHNIADVDVAVLQERKGSGAVITKYDLQKELLAKYNLPISESQGLMHRPDSIAHTPHDQQLTPTAQDTIKLVHQAGGLAVLAHPGKIVQKVGSPEAMWRIIKKLMTAGLDGLEVFAFLNTPQQQKEFWEFANKNNLLKTGGSDYHGPIHAPERKLGSFGVDETLWQELQNRLVK